MSKIDKIISANLKQAREKSGISQQAMAEMMGIEPVRLSLIEKGLEVVTPTTLYHMCFILDCSPDKVFPSIRVRGITAGKRNELRGALKEIINRLAA
jgi:transcriptional regulator with XRE-family HTH domain